MTVHLASITLYPIKSVGGISVDTWDVDQFGLRYDRRWMVVDQTGVHVTQRTHPRLALVRPIIDGDRLQVTAPDRLPLEVPLEPQDRTMTTATVWDDTCAAHWTGPSAAAWFSEFLGMPCSLVYMPSTTIRPADPDFAPPGARVSFADAFPFLLISRESLADLNHRLASPLPMNRFRPNLVIAGGEAFGEDAIDTFEIGGLGFRTVKPCARCAVTTTDQVTARRGREPLRTLATYRRVGGEVMFGQNVVHLGTGRLTVGTPLLVHARSTDEDGACL